eukprot:1160890-Pelagomonas_calceolata.AAC.3
MASCRTALNRRNPSAAQLLGELTAQERLPILIIGSGRNSDCIPRSSNYESFYKEANVCGACQVGFNKLDHYSFDRAPKSMIHKRAQALCALAVASI